MQNSTSYNHSVALAIVTWQRKHGRNNLPWQGVSTRYEVWISEIMLQQTQVVTVIDYFKAFIARFPTLQSLAQSQEHEVLALWSGLGYYRRARHLWQAAKQAYIECSDDIPNTADGLLKLPGIGRSTAHAILSLANNIPLPILDANVKRVFIRLYALNTSLQDAKNTNKLWDIAQDHMPRQHARRYNQGLMDLGAGVCTQKKPQCNQCPIQPYCLANKHHKQDVLPLPSLKKKQKPQRYVSFLACMHQDEILLSQSPADGIWPSLWVMPQFKQIKSIKTVLPQTLHSKLKILETFKHTFSHYHLHIQLVLLDLSCKESLSLEHSMWVKKSMLKNYGVPAALTKALKLIHNYRVAKEIESQ